MSVVITLHFTPSSSANSGFHGNWGIFLGFSKDYLLCSNPAATGLLRHDTLTTHGRRGPKSLKSEIQLRSERRAPLQQLTRFDLTLFLPLSFCIEREFTAGNQLSHLHPLPVCLSPPLILSVSLALCYPLSLYSHHMPVIIIFHLVHLGSTLLIIHWYPVAIKLPTAIYYSP